MWLTHYWCLTVFTTVLILQNDHTSIFEVRKRKNKATILSHCHREERLLELPKELLNCTHASVTLLCHPCYKAILGQKKFTEDGRWCFGNTPT